MNIFHLFLFSISVNEDSQKTINKSSVFLRRNENLNIKASEKKRLALRGNRWAKN